MQQKILSIRPFIGAKDFDTSCNFYRDLGFEETVLFANMSVFKMQHIAFYLQDAYVEDWINNSMLFIEVEDVNEYWKELTALDLTTTYKNVKLIPVSHHDWGSECFIHDPCGVLWHFGTFAK